MQARLPDHLEDPVGFLCVSGWRVDEMRRLEWRDVDRSAGRIRLRAELAKSGRERVLPLRGELARIIGGAARRRTYTRSDGSRATAAFVFHVEGRPLGEFGKAFRTAASAIGCPDLTPHDLRRSAARNLIRTGVPEKIARDFIGHRTSSMFDRYNITAEADLVAATERLTAYVRRMRGKGQGRTRADDRTS